MSRVWVFGWLALACEPQAQVNVLVTGQSNAVRLDLTELAAQINGASDVGEVAANSTGFEGGAGRWAPGGDLAVASDAWLASARTPSAVVNVMGEADAHQQVWADEYESAMRQRIAAWWTASGSEIPVFIIPLRPDSVTGRPGGDTIRQAQLNLATDLENVHSVMLDTVPGFDGLHFGDDGSAAYAEVSRIIGAAVNARVR